MRALRIIVTACLSVALIAGTAFGAGFLYDRYAEDSNNGPNNGRSEKSSADGPGKGIDSPSPEAQPGQPTGDSDPEPEKAAKAPTLEPKPTLKPGPALLSSGDSGETVRDLQARLKEIAWLSGLVTGTYDATTLTAVEGFQAKRQIPVTGEVDQRTLDRLHAMSSTPSHEAKHNIAPPSGESTNAGLDPRCLTGTTLCIDKTSQSMRYVVSGKVQSTYDVRFGSELTPTREGAFSVEWKSPDHVSSLYDTPMPFAMFFSGGQAVHYSSDFAATGYNGASHGCVNVRDYDGLKWLFDQVSVGTPVIVYRS